MRRYLVNNVDIHVINSCNLACYGCNHYANYGYGGPFSAEELIEWITAWKDRIFFKRISLMGGEPLLNPNLKEICIAFRRLFSSDETKLRIMTNGILVSKCHWLKELIQDYQVHIQVSSHVLTGQNINEKYIRQVKEGLSLLNKWSQDSSGQKQTKWAPFFLNKEKLNFQLFYSGAYNNIKPYDENDIINSKKYCTCKSLQLYKSKLYKCAPIAYVGEALETIGKAEDPNWQPYLKYCPLTPDCTDSDLDRFLKQHPLPEWICRMCPPFSNTILSDERKIYERE